MRLIVGQGGSFNSNSAGGGGSSSIFNLSTNELLFVAGGSGGVGKDSSIITDASLNNYGLTDQKTNNTLDNSVQLGYNGLSNNYGSYGSGWYSFDNLNYDSNDAIPLDIHSNGGRGSISNTFGGFGGGGNGNENYNGSGGGGGYTGGNSGINGGSGGSYIINTAINVNKTLDTRLSVKNNYGLPGYITIVYGNNGLYNPPNPFNTTDYYLLLETYMLFINYISILYLYITVKLYIYIN